MTWWIYTKKLEKFVLLDFSGTLSIEAVNFGQTETLYSYLEKSGLVELGVASETFFWNEIVTPTWPEGSTTRRGYAGIIADRIISLSADGNNLQRNLAVQKAASLFMASYFDHCRIDPAWKNILRSLQNDPSTQVAVVTDHYAEATAMITDRMAAWDIDAIPLEKAAKGTKNPLIIANSADVGFHKIDCRFWRAFHDRLFHHDHDDVRILFIDDFGANEAIGDNYGNNQFTPREERTRKAIKKVWGNSVDVYPFIIRFAKTDPPQAAERKKLYSSLVEKALAYIQGFVSSSCG